MAAQPERGLVWLLRQLSSRAAADAAIGDVLDELADRTQAGRAPRWPRVWVNTQTIKLALPFVAAMVPRLFRAGWQTLRDAARSLRRSPAYSALIIALLTVGITAGTITYSVVDAVVLRPLAIDRGDRLVSVSTRDDKFQPRITADGFRAIRDQVTSFDGVAKVSIESFSIVTVAGVSDQISVLSASSDLFGMLRFGSGLGRLWTVDDEERGDIDVAVLSYRYWMDHFHADPGVLGQTVAKGAYTYRIIGVLGADTDIPGLDYSTAEIWLPMHADASFAIAGVLRPGVSTAQVAEDIQRVLATPDWRPTVTSYLERNVTRIRGWMLLALGAAGLIILIACVNVANIMLTRSFRRGQELAIRSSLGASRWQIALSVMAEGLILSTIASAGALIISIWGIAAAKVAVTTYMPGTFRASTIALDRRVLLAAIAAAIATGVCSALAPAIQASRASVSGVLKDAGPTVTGGARSWRSALLIGEVASVSVLLVISWLFVVSLIRVVNIDLGIDRDHLLAVSSNMEFNGTVDEVRARLESVPGVTGVAMSVGSLPIIGRAYGGAWPDTSVTRADASEPPVKLQRYRVTANYFDVAGLRFRRGGTWRTETALNSPSVVLDERAATMLFAAENPIGKQVRVTDPAGVFAVVGIVPYVYTSGPEEVVKPSAYFAAPATAARKFATMFVRVSPPPEEMVPVLKAAIAPFAPPGKREYVHIADEAVRRITAIRRFNGGLMSAFGALAMVIGAAGIYSVIAALVTQQRREIGVRVALGATPQRIYRSVLSLAGRHIVVGLIIGLPLAWWISRGFAAHLFQVTPADPSVYLGVTALVGAVGLLAVLIPARRASKTDPMITLRS
ncbi:MAG TPA: FtsX-like permease family protein [Vicinamibacterales bacterium]|nr:FtsX-like permease family protein [Vicinamibacterales bacterium]